MVEKTIISKKISLTANSIIRVLLYSDIFHYPLTVDEIYQRCEIAKATKEEIKEELDKLVKSKLVYTAYDFYCLRDNPEMIIKRENGNTLAKKFLKKAVFFSGIIASFPFVRCVMISGSLSKDFIDEDGDIDYFIITEPKRVWLVKAMLLFFKMVFLFDSHKYFCINYLLDYRHLEVDPKNPYTALEVNTLIPTYGKDIYLDFINKNNWTKIFYPHFYPKSLQKIKPAKSYYFKYFFEKLLDNRLGEWIDTQLMKGFSKNWYRRYRPLFPNEEEYNKAVEAERHVCRAHPKGYHRSILDSWEERIKSFEAKHQLSLVIENEIS